MNNDTEKNKKVHKKKSQLTRVNIPNPWSES